jgi:hypothetical protein
MHRKQNTPSASTKIIALLPLLAGLSITANAQTSTMNTTKTQSAPFYYQPQATQPLAQTLETDVCIYGGNSAGVVAALQVSRLGKKAVILEQGTKLGGLSAGGLSMTDIGNKSAIGGISREFYRRCGQKYGVAEEWRFEPKVASQVFQEMVDEAKCPLFYRQFLKSVEMQGQRIVSITMESGLKVRARVFIDVTYEGDLMAKSGVKFHVGREANTVYGETLNGVQVRNTHQFNFPVDPYIEEGKPASGVLPGINPGEPGKSGDGDHRVQAYTFRLCLTNDPENRIPYEKPAGYNPQEYVLLARYFKAGFPESDVFQKFDPIRNSLSRRKASGTTLVAADISNLRGLIIKLRNAGGPLTKYLKERFSPAVQQQLNLFKDQEPLPQELSLSVVEQLNQQITGPLLYSQELFVKVALSTELKSAVATKPQGQALAKLNRALLEAAYPDEIGGRYQKVDKNNHGGISTDFIGRNYDYPNADYATRERIFQEHVTYQKGLMWFLGNDPSVPENIRKRWSQWGLPKDEFVETGGWPHQLYVREARRMISDYVMTEHDCTGKRAVEDPVSLAAYTMDSHNCQRFIEDKGTGKDRVRNEGDVQVHGFPPYPISYRSIVPKKGECENLVVPVCLSASHIAYGSIRMEPVFMILGQSAAYAAHLAINNESSVQAVPYDQMRELLVQGEQVLSWQKPADGKLPDPNDHRAQ